MYILFYEQEGQRELLSSSDLENYSAWASMNPNSGDDDIHMIPSSCTSTEDNFQVQRSARRRRKEQQESKGSPGKFPNLYEHFNCSYRCFSKQNLMYVFR